MWIPVVNESVSHDASAPDDVVVEAILAVVPEAVLAGIEFVWVRVAPNSRTPEPVVVSFRIDSQPADRLAALVLHNERFVLEIYLDNVRSALTDAWLEREWGIRRTGLELSLTEKLEVALFGLLTHLAIRRGLVDDAKSLTRRIGHVIFRAAVRHSLHNLQLLYPSLDLGAVSPSPSGDPSGPVIDAQEVATTDFNRLLRQLLGLESPPVNPPGPGPSSGR